jgi:protein-L-isoaspartate(D-aspartate) O-methyltransferase
MDARLADARRELRRILEARGIADAAVLDAMDAVPREEFVPADLRVQAYDNIALPVGHEQTISQPLMVALMTHELALRGNENVLEVGTGTGYQTAILARLARHVVTIERVPELAAGAQARLDRLGFRNIEFRVGDGTLGCPEQAPFDAILVTAGAPKVPDPLYQQLRTGGRLVVPVGDATQQDLLVVEKTGTSPRVRDAGGCRFVRLVGAAGWDEEG